jgi:hypothetical protein
MSNVIELDKYKKEQSEKPCDCDFVCFLAMCICCFSRWKGRAAVCVNMFTLECPFCHKQDSFCTILPDYFYIKEPPSVS